jgi:putative transposase
MKTFVGKVKLNQAQKAKATAWLRDAKRLQNELLEWSLQTKGGRASYFDLCKKQVGANTDLPSAMRYGVAHRVAEQTKRYVKGYVTASGVRAKSGKPRFKSLNIRAGSLSWFINQGIPSSRARKTSSKNNVYYFDIPVLKTVKAHFNGPLCGLTIKCATLKLDSCGDWWLHLSVSDAPDTYVLPEPVVAEIGVDLGIKESFVASSLDGKHVVRSAQTIDKVRKNISRISESQKKGTQAFVHRKIARERKHNNHVSAKAVAASAAKIYIGDVSPKWLFSNTKLARSAGQIGIAQLKSFIICKAEKAGRCVKVVNERHTSKACSSCGAHLEITLAEREVECPKCGFAANRDVNAAINICKQGLGLFQRPDTSLQNERETTLSDQKTLGRRRSSSFR